MGRAGKQSKLPHSARAAAKAWRRRIQGTLPRHMQQAGKEVVAWLASEMVTAEMGDHIPELFPMLRLAARLADEVQRTRGAAHRHGRTLAQCTTPRDERLALLSILAEPSGRVHGRDRAALRRWLDAEAISDRDAAQLHQAQQRLQFCATFIAGALERQDDDFRFGTANNRQGLTASAHFFESIAADPAEPWTLRVAVVELLAQLGVHLPAWRRRVAQHLLTQIAAVGDEPWAVAAALKCYVLGFAEPEEEHSILAAAVVPSRAQAALASADHRFARARAVELCVARGHWDLVGEVLARPDASEHVRCAAVRALAAEESHQAYALLRRTVVGPNGDAHPVVRATGAVAALPTQGTMVARRTALVSEFLASETEPWVLETIIDAIWTRRNAMVASESLGLAAKQWPVELARAMDPQMPRDLRLRAATLVHWLGTVATPLGLTALVKVETWLKTARAGTSHCFTGTELGQLSPKQLEKLLVVAAADGFDLGATPHRLGTIVHCGAVRKLAAWRLMHELCNLGPDKRQAYSHIVDRVPRGSIVALSQRLSEASPTRVPGGRVAGPASLDWGCDLPLPSHLVGSGGRAQMTLLTPLERIVLRRQASSLLAHWAVQRRYVHFDRERRRCLAERGERGGDEAVRRYDDILRAGGFDVQRTGWHGAFLPFGAGDMLTHELFQPDLNTLGQLAFLACGLCLYVLGRNVVVHRRVARLRGRLPLVVGGWGSRGKSGTERLKVGLFLGLGYRVASKTTGSEAVFIAGTPGTDPVEIPLYRAYDKASIWEQFRFLRLASGLRAQVTLWECMALTPDYVQVLQRDWMRDDLSTITNTYPDHEDVQGPSGQDVAEVIGLFMPNRAEAITTEQHMTPVLREAATARDTTLKVCSMDEWRLIPPDLLARIPYDEHPRNIALVAELARRLDIPGDVALRAMADQVVADIGVLKEYGPATYQERSMTFVNGMAANERAGLLSNWQRTGLGSFSSLSGVEDRVVVLINNRADRPARQAVFAKLSAEELSADAFVVIGTHVRGFCENFRRHLDVSVRQELVRVGHESRLQLIGRMAKRFRRPILSPSDLVVGLEKALLPAHCSRQVAVLCEQARQASFESLGELLLRRDPLAAEEEPQTAIRRYAGEALWLWRLQQQLEAWTPEAVVEDFVTAFAARLIPLDNPDLSGDQIIVRLALLAPPGSHTRIYGAQNIKGTGFDFVHRWIGLERVQQWLDGLADERATDRHRAVLGELAGYTNYGLLDARLAVDTLGDGALARRLTMVGLSSDRRRAHKRAEQALANCEAEAAGPEQRRTVLVGRLLAGLEGLLDFVDSVRRTRTIDRLYDDLVHHRVGRAKAARIARSVQGRQNGGWLFRKGGRWLR